jgi:PAS domain S-box-containing protein
MRFVRINDALAAMNGLRPEQHIGLTPMELIPDVPQDAYPPYFEAALRGEGCEFELEGSTRTGARRVWLERVYPLRDRDGRLTGAGVFVLDITARKIVERERERAMVALQRSLLPGEIPHPPGATVATRSVAAPGATRSGATSTR